MKNETYLGDGVYVSFDGYQIWLDTRMQEPVNRIALEPDVYAALQDWWTKNQPTTSDTESAMHGGGDGAPRKSGNRGTW